MFHPFESFAVGQPSILAKAIMQKPEYGAWGSDQGGALMHVSPDGGSIQIYHVMPDISDAEQLDYRRGPFKIYLGEVDGVIYFVWECYSGRFDLTYEPALSAVQHFERTQFNPQRFLDNKNLRMQVQYLLFDANGYTTKAIRMFTLTNRMSYLFQKMAHERIQKPTVQITDHFMRVAKINARYPIKELIKKSLIYTKWDDGGESGGTLQ